MYLSDVDHSISFDLPCEGSEKKLSVTLRSWAQGLTPVDMDDYLRLEGSDLQLHFNRIWAYPLQEIRKQNDRITWTLWRNEVPSHLLQRLQRNGLDTVGSLYLLFRFPDLEQALDNPMFFSCIVNDWSCLILHRGMDSAMSLINKKLSMPRYLALWYSGEGDPEPVSPLMIKLMRYLPGNLVYHKMRLEFPYRNYDALLPHFFNSPWRFREKLNALNCFYAACLDTELSLNCVVPLFYKALKQRKKVRQNNLTLLFMRLRGVHEVLGKPPITGLLQGAPSIRFLEKYLCRQERLLEKRGTLSRFQQSAVIPEFPVHTFPTSHCIEPLLTHEDLLREGRYMNNCIACYESSITTGKNAAFRMAWPERGTVLLVEEEGQWLIEDARTFHDEEMNSETSDFIRQWLAGAPVQDVATGPYPYYCYKKIASDGTELWPYQGEVRRWVQMSGNTPCDHEFDAGMGDDFYGDPVIAFDDAMECMDGGTDFSESDPWKDPAPYLTHSPQMELPDSLGKWFRARHPEQLLQVGFDPDMISPSLCAAIEDNNKPVYLHPHLSLCYAIVHRLDDPDNSVELVKHHVPWQKGKSSLALQLETDIRLALQRHTFSQHY